MQKPNVKVGIMNATAVRFILNGSFHGGGGAVAGCHEVALSADGTAIMLDGRLVGEQLEFTPDDMAGCSFGLFGVTIGRGFHWQMNEDQTFRGSLRFIVEDGGVTAVNIIPVEEYLMSVISSEMSATSSMELLKAHAVISRSWLLAQIGKCTVHADGHDKDCGKDGTVVNGSEILRWYDKDDHLNYDVCADDHCQRYQGITRQTSTSVSDAVRATEGEVLMYGGGLCDARFSKCCGGVFEEFRNCWQPIDVPYLSVRRDTESEDGYPDLTKESNAREWILGNPDSFCNTGDAAVLSQVLNNYDQETADFYRWTVEYSQDELAGIIKERSGIDFGQIVDLVPVARGTSGRLWKLEIVGTKRTMVIGKELEIRRTLSPTHLYSSAFTVEKCVDGGGDVPSRFILHGAGWGHGVGLCQIGAAVMGARGYSYTQILYHYFSGSSVEKIY